MPVAGACACMQQQGVSSELHSCSAEIELGMLEAYEMTLLFWLVGCLLCYVPSVLCSWICW
jgi:hypothetical protein